MVSCQSNVSQLGGVPPAAYFGRSRPPAEVSGDDFASTMKTNLCALDWTPSGWLAAPVAPRTAIIATASIQACEPSSHLLDHATTKAGIENERRIARSVGQPPRLAARGCWYRMPMDRYSDISVVNAMLVRSGHPMLRPFLIGIVAGQRGITPLAAIAMATFQGKIAPRLPLQTWFLDSRVTAATAGLAAAEMAGDKMKSAPDRVVPIGLLVRSITSAYAGAALAPRDRQLAGAVVAVGSALVSSYLGWRIRCAAMEKYGQTASGLVEDAIVATGGLAVAGLVEPPKKQLSSSRRK